MTVYRMISAEKARELVRLLGYAEDRAGGFMTTVLLVMQLTDTAEMPSISGTSLIVCRSPP